MIKYRIVDGRGKLVSVSYSTILNDDGEPYIAVNDRILKDLRFYKNADVDGDCQIFVDGEYLKTVKLHRKPTPKRTTVRVGQKMGA